MVTFTSALLLHFVLAPGKSGMVSTASRRVVASVCAILILVMLDMLELCFGGRTAFGGLGELQGGQST